MFDPTGPTLKDNITQTEQLYRTNKDQKEYEKTNNFFIHSYLRAEFARIGLDVAEYERAAVAHALCFEKASD